MINELIKFKNLVTLILGILSLGVITLVVVKDAFAYGSIIIFLVSVGIFGLLFYVYVKFSRLKERIIFKLMHFLIPICMFLLLEFMQQGKIFSLRPIEYIANIFIHFMIWLVLLVIVRRTTIAGILGLAVVYGIGVINHFLVLYRGEPIMPSYILSIRTALSVAGSYDFYYDERLLIGTSILIGIILWLIFSGGFHIKIDNMFFKVLLALGALTVGSFFWGLSTLTLTDDIGTGINLWDTDGFYQRHGYLLSFTIFYQNMHIKEPEGYSQEKINGYLDPYVLNEDIENQEKPDILIVMNESLADFEDFEFGQFNKSPLKHFYEARANTLWGRVYVSVFGGETANSEYEMMTGNPIGLLPRASVPYQEYMKGEQNSLVSLLESQGYQSLAIHPYYASGYNRDRAWESFGFDERYFLDSKPGLQEAPNIEYFRDYVTDDSIYKFWEQKADEAIQKEDKPLFSLIVTMQNHGGYKGENFSGSTIWLKDKPHLYPQMQEYLTSVEKADVAIDDLLDYVDSRNRKTIVLIFGDHQPSVEENFFVYAMGSDQSEHQKYKTPYIIHSNFELKKLAPEKLSANYLGMVLMRETNLKLSPYQEFQYQIMQKLPVITRHGYMDTNGDWFSKDDNRFSSLISPYFEVLYNNVFDSKKKDAHYKIVTTGG